MWTGPRRWGLAVTVAAALCYQTHADPVGADTLFEMDYRWDKEVVTLGDEITVTIDVLRGKEYRLLPLPERLNFPPFEIKRIESFGPEERGTSVREGFRLVFTVFELGQFKIPKFAVSFTDDEGRPGQVLTDEIRIEVISVGRKPEDTNDIRPIKGPFKFHPRLDPARLIGFAVPLFILLLILAYLLVRFLRRRHLEKMKLLTPYERAVQLLDRLEKKPLTGPAAVREFCEGLSDGVRRYFIDQYQAGSPDQTTRQYLETVREKEFAPGTHKDLREILELSDFVKFAKFSAPVSDLRAGLKLARKVVEANQPAVEAPDEDAPQEAVS